VNSPLNGTAGHFDVVSWDFHSFKQLAKIAINSSLNIFAGSPAYSAAAYGDNLFLCLKNEASTGPSNTGAVLQVSNSSPSSPALVSTVPWSSNSTAAAPIAAASAAYVALGASQPSVITLYKYK